MQDVEVFVARQAIFDHRRRLYGYELLYRSDAEHNAFDGTEAGVATTQVISSSLLAIGLDNILGGKKAFLNLDRNVLVSGLHLGLPKESLVIELLETVEPDPELLEVCQQLRRQGYTIALDDFTGDPRSEPLTQVADMIKVDMRQTGKPDQERLVRKYKPRGVRMLAEKVETPEEFRWARGIGYDYFQGYFFARPVVIQGRQLASSTVACLRLLREAQHPELDFERIENLISEDVSFSYKLLRYVNSPLFMSAQPINSIREAVVRVGEYSMRRWVVLAALPQLAAKKPAELATLSLTRAHFCECVAQLASIEEHEGAFLMGLFSLLDALIDRPLDEALSEVKLASKISDVLLELSPDTERLTILYKLARRYEAGDWDEVVALAEQLGVPPGTVGDAYVDAVRWSNELIEKT